MRLNTLAGMMLQELIAEFEDYFAFNENLLVLLPFFDILKTSIFLFGTREKIQSLTENNYEYKIINVKFNLTPSVEDVINKLIKLLNSESHLITLIHDSDNIKTLFLLDISRVALNFLEIIHNHDSECIVTKRRLKSTLNRCKTAKLLLEIIARFQGLANIELSHSFKIYKTLKHSSKRNDLIGGIIYFLFIICFETFTPGLNEFIRLSLKDLDNILELNPSLNYFNPELNLIRSVLALNNRSDQYAIDCLLHFFIFEIKDLNTDFLIMLKSFLNVSTSKEIEISIKLIQKFGNQNLVNLFIKSYELLEHEHLKCTIEVESKFGSKNNLNLSQDIAICGEEKNLNLAQIWIQDFNNCMKFEG